MPSPLLRRDPPTSTQLLARLLETPNLAAHVQALPSQALAALVARVGLEDAGELVAFATPEQLADIFDEELWRNEVPGEDETFDAERFVAWLEVMLEGGDACVAEKLAALPEDLVTLAFHRQVLVLDLESLMAEIDEAGDDVSGTEKALASCLSEEIDGFEVVSRRHDGWDAVLSALLALDRDHHDCLARLLHRCSALSRSYIEESGGLYEVLTSDEMLEADVAADREDRRAAAGHVSASSAAAFLRIAAEAEQPTPISEHDPMTRAYLRDLARTSRAAAPRSFAPMLRLGDGGSAREVLLAAALRELAVVDPAAFAERSEEIAYLANVIIAGCGTSARKVRPAVAVQAAMDACTLGLELRLRDAPRRSRSAATRTAAATALLRDHTADGLFRLAWSRIRRDRRRELVTEEPIDLERLRSLASVVS